MVITSVADACGSDWDFIGRLHLRVNLLFKDPDPAENCDPHSTILEKIKQTMI